MESPGAVLTTCNWGDNTAQFTSSYAHLTHWWTARSSQRTPSHTVFFASPSPFQTWNASPEQRHLCRGGVAVFDLWLKCERGSNTTIHLCVPAEIMMHGVGRWSTLPSPAAGTLCRLLAAQQCRFIYLLQLLCSSCSGFLLTLPEQWWDPAPQKSCVCLVWLQHKFQERRTIFHFLWV